VVGCGLAVCLRAIASSAAFSMLSGGQRRMEGNRWPICSEQEVALGADVSLQLKEANVIVTA
jgi:hypothetical protein